MKLSCQIIRDLIPLYEDGVCSQESREAVLEHLSECEECRALVQSTQLLPELALQPDEPQTEQAVVSSFRKLRRRWRMSLIAMLVLIPVCLFGYLGYHEASNRGLSFSNLDEAILANRFVDALESGNYADAATQFDYAGKYARAQEKLSRSVESHLPTVETVTIGDEKWIVHKTLFEEHLHNTGDSMQTWQYLANNGVFGVLIPEDVWYQLVTEAEQYSHTDDHAEILNGFRYRRWESIWGNYWVVEDVWEILEEDLPGCFSSGVIQMIPEKMYRDIEDDLYTLAENAWNGVQLFYQDAATLDEASYIASKQALYAQAWQELRDLGYQIKDYGYYYVHDGVDATIVTHKILVQFGEESMTTYLDLYYKDGVIICVAVHYSGESPWIHVFIDAVYETV